MPSELPNEGTKSEEFSCYEFAMFTRHECNLDEAKGMREPELDALAATGFNRRKQREQRTGQYPKGVQSLITSAANHPFFAG